MLAQRGLFLPRFQPKPLQGQALFPVDSPRKANLSERKFPGEQELPTLLLAFRLQPFFFLSKLFFTRENFSSLKIIASFFIPWQ